MRIAIEYTFATILNQSYLISIGKKENTSEEVVRLNETSAFLLGTIYHMNPTMETLIEYTCKEYEPETEEEVKEISQLVFEFIDDVMKKGFVVE